MIEYIALIAFVLVFSPILLLKKRFRWITLIYTLICFGVLLCMSAMRTRIGFDYSVYSRTFFLAGRDGFETLTYGKMEIGFVLLGKIVCYFIRDVRVYMAIVALISLAGPCFVICKYSKKVWLSVLLYINLYFFYLTMNFLRQSLAVSITMFALPFLLKRKIFPYIIPYIAIVALAATFHKSALIMLLVYFVVRVKPSPSWKVPFVYGSLITVFLIFSDSIIDSLGKIDFLSRYAYAHYRNTIFWKEGLGLIHGVIPTIVIALCVFFFLRGKKIKYNKECNTPLAVYSNLMYVGYVFMIMMLKHAILERVSYYTYIYVILFIPEIMEFVDVVYKKHLNKKLNRLAGNMESVDEELDNEGKDGVAAAAKDIGKVYKVRRKIIAFCITAVVVVGTVSYNVYGLLEGDDGVHGVYPYQSWLYSSPEN